jgi:hypothetical protein
VLGLELRELLLRVSEDAGVHASRGEQLLSLRARSTFSVQLSRHFMELCFELWNLVPFGLLGCNKFVGVHARRLLAS